MAVERVVPARSGFDGTLRRMKCRTRHSPMERRFIVGPQKFPDPLLWNIVGSDAGLFDWCEQLL
jgi:hypothetical protein